MEKNNHKHISRGELIIGIDKCCRAIHKNLSDEAELAKIIVERKKEIDNCAICCMAVIYNEGMISGRGLGAIINYNNDED